jgi:hypothetical protein
MLRDKRRLLALVLACAAYSPPMLGAQLGPPPPSLSENQKSFLSNLAERAIRDIVQRRSPYQPSYVPSGLQGIEAEVVVRLWHHGYLLASGLGERAPIAEAARKAAVSAGTVLLNENETAADLLPDLVIEVEAAGPPEAIENTGDWTRSGVSSRGVVLGLHGLIFLGAGSNRRVYPSEFIRTDLPLDDALQALAQFMQMTPTQVTNTPLQRFRTTHWYQASRSSAVVSLQRGLVLQPPTLYTAKDLDTAMASIAEYMLYRQLPSGLFSYQFNPGGDRYSDEENLVRQVSATAAISAYARQSGQSAPRGAADLAIRYHLQGLRPFEGRDDAAFISTSDGANELGVTALLCIAMANHPEAGSFAPTRGKLVKGVLALQRPSGMFLTAFPPAVKLNEQDYFPGEALLALAMEYEKAPAPELLDAFDRAIVFYRDYFRSRRSIAFVPWQVQAFASMARQTNRADFTEFVFELTDWVSRRQLTTENCEWPELHGAFADDANSDAGISTAPLLEALADALALAREAKDEERVLRYEDLVRDACRFVLQLQFRKEEAYSMRSPKDAVGGVRASPALNRLRIDYAGHALMSLIKARRALFPTES